MLCIKFVMTRKKKTTTRFIKRNSLNFEHIETTIASQRNDKNRNRKRDQSRNEREERNERKEKKNENENENENEK